MLNGLLLFLGFFQAQIEKSNIPFQVVEPDTHDSSARTAQEIDDLEESLKDHEVRITQMNNSYETLLQRNLQLTELRHVLKESSIFFEQVKMMLTSFTDQELNIFIGGIKKSITTIRYR